MKKAMPVYEEGLRKQQEKVEWQISGIDDDKLTLKEAAFIESIEKQSSEGRYLSQAQMDWLWDIYQRKGR